MWPKIQCLQEPGLEERAPLWNHELCSKTLRLLLNTPLFFLQRKPMSISLDIFTTLPLEDAQGLHFVLKDGSSYMTAISKGQDTHTEKPSFSLTFSKHTVAMRHLAPTTVPPKAPNGCQFPCAFTRRIIEKAVLCRRIPLWLGWSSKVYCLPMDGWPVFSDLAQYQNSCN